MARPFINKTVFELQEYFEFIKENPKELKKLAAELKHRKVPKAVILAKQVKFQIDKIADTSKQNDAKNNYNESKSPLDQKIIECETCKQKLRITLHNVVREYSCPKCKNGFRASFTDGILSVVFLKNSNHNESETQSEKITIEHAYKLFEANEYTPWEQIELTRRRLIQQYHPDKVHSLGEKLRKVAEAEGILINTAFELLKKHRGF